jgi:poly(beta-D-mannuronate) lyase
MKHIKIKQIPLFALLQSLVIFISFVFCPFTTTAQDTAGIKTTAALLNAISGAKPGDVIILEDGIFDTHEVHISAKGAAGKPIEIRAKNRGKALFGVPLKIEGEYISLVGMGFKEKGAIAINGKNCRVSRCTWSDAKSGKWIQVLPGCSEIEIDHNLFENKTNNREMDRNCQLIQVVVRNKNERHHIHHNLFRDIPKGKTGNGFETLQLITENNPFDPPGGHSNSVIEDNLFIRCNGESEIISVKSNGNIVRRNTFRACAGSLVLRHGDDNVATGNFFFGDGEKESGGVRLQGTGQIVANNYFEGLGQLSLGMMDGTPDDLYIRVERAQILFNSFINCPKNFIIGLNHSKHPNGTAPKECKIAGNLFYFDKAQTPANFIEYVQNDQPENWVWTDNIAFGAPVIQGVPGIRTENPKLKFRGNKLAFPSAKTLQTECAGLENEKIKYDLFQTEWKKKRSVGAIQFPADRRNYKFLTERTVGPYAD